MQGIFYRILSVPQNNVMDLNNVTWTYFLVKTIILKKKRKFRNEATHNSGNHTWPMHNPCIQLRRRTNNLLFGMLRRGSKIPFKGGRIG
jgi:hypothetical protein